MFFGIELSFSFLFCFFEMSSPDAISCFGQKKRMSSLDFRGTKNTDKCVFQVWVFSRCSHLKKNTRPKPIFMPQKHASEGGAAEFGWSRAPLNGPL